MPGVGEVLGLVRYQIAAELHDAHRVGGHAVIGDHALVHPKVATASDPQDGEVAVGRVPAALRLDLRPAPETFSGLRVVQDRVCSIDSVLGVDVSSSEAFQCCSSRARVLASRSVVLFT